MVAIATSYLQFYWRTFSLEKRNFATRDASWKLLARVSSHTTNLVMRRCYALTVQFRDGYFPRPNVAHVVLCAFTRNTDSFTSNVGCRKKVPGRRGAWIESPLIRDDFLTGNCNASLLFYL